MNWDKNKNLDDFEEIEKNLRSEGEISRSEALHYLIKRCKIAEKALDEIRSVFPEDESKIKLPISHQIIDIYNKYKEL